MSVPATQPTERAALPDLLDESRTDRSVVVRVALIVATAVLFILGIVFWIIPVLTGIPFWILGFITLGMASRPAARWINRRERKLPYKLRLLLRPGLRRRLKEQG